MSTLHTWVQQVNDQGINLQTCDKRERGTPVRVDRNGISRDMMGQSKRQISPSLHASLQNLGLSGIYSIWSTMDLKSKCFRTSAKGGPSWKDVEARVTLDVSNGNTIKIEATSDIT